MLSRRNLFKWIGACVASVIGIKGEEAACKPLNDAEPVVWYITDAVYSYDGEPTVLYSFEDGEPLIL